MVKRGSLVINVNSAYYRVVTRVLQGCNMPSKVVFLKKIISVRKNKKIEKKN